MTRIPLSDTGSTPWERLMGHTPNVLTHWLKLEEVFFSSRALSPELLEQVRRALAFENGCEYCMAKAGPPNANQTDFRVSLALGFAQVFGSDHKGIDSKMLSTLREHFSEKELVELIAFMAFISAEQMFGAVFGLQPAQTYATVQSCEE